MNNKTKQTFVIAIITLVLTAGACLFFFNEIRAQGLVMEEKINILNTNNGKEVAFNHLNKIIKDTETERTEISSVFFQDESDSISFLNEIESLAPSFGVDFKTEALEKISKEGTEREVIKISFSYTGEKDRVLKFTELIESIPYHSQVDSLSLNEISSGNFEGKITILITIQPL